MTDINDRAMARIAQIDAVLEEYGIEEGDLDMPRINRRSMRTADIRAGFKSRPRIPRGILTTQKAFATDK